MRNSSESSGIAPLEVHRTPEVMLFGTNRFSLCRLAILGVVVAAMTLAGYQQIFSTFAIYDDESYVMMAVDQYIDGHLLYEQIYTQYGPGFFAVQSFLHQQFGWEMGHDLNRLKTLSVWLITSLLSAIFVYRLGRNGWLSLAALVLTFCHLEKLCLEPGHPQELCALVLAAILVASTFFRGKGALAAAAFCGFFTAFVVTTKINVGGLIGLSMTLCLLAGTKGSLARYAFLGLAILCTLLPWGLCFASFDSLASVKLPLVCSTLCGLLLVTRLRVAPEPCLTWSMTFTYVLTTAVVSAFFVTVGVQHGTSWEAMYFGMVGQHRGFSGMYYQATPLSVLAIPLCVGAVVWQWRSGATFDSEKMRGVKLAVCLTGTALLAIGYLLTAAIPLAHGLAPRGGVGLVLSLAAPFIWLMLLNEEHRKFDAGRWLVCFGVALWPLCAYPSPGTQFEVATFPLLLALLVGVGECVGEWDSTPRVDWTSLAWIPVGVALAACTVLAVRDVTLSSRRARLTRLDLPGARLLKLEAEVVEQQRWITRQLRENSDTFAFLQHGHNRFYYWTELPAPTPANPSFSPYRLSAQDQSKIVVALQRHERSMLVEHEYPVHISDDSPLKRYSVEQTETQFERDGWALKRRRL